MTDKTCKERIEEEYESEMETLRTLWKNDCEGIEDSEDGNIFEHGLCFDYCYPTKRDAGYFRYQISWGGPSDEFRIYANQVKHGWEVYRIEYWFLDWFDGASKTLHGEDFKFMKSFIESFFGETESMKYEFEKAMENYEPEEDDENKDEEDIDTESN